VIYLKTTKNSSKFLCNKIVRNVHLLFKKVAVKSGIYAHAFYTTVIYSSDLFTYLDELFEQIYTAKPLQA